MKKVKSHKIDLVLLTILALFYQLPLIKAAEWKTFVLEGFFDDEYSKKVKVYTYDFLIGKGKTTFSPSLDRVIENDDSGLTLLVYFNGVGSWTNWISTNWFTLKAEKFAFLGKYEPTNISSSNIQPILLRPMMLNHYFYLQSGSYHCIVQPINFTVSDLKCVKRSISGDLYAGYCKLECRYISAPSIEKLNQLLNGSEDVKSTGVSIEKPSSNTEKAKVQQSNLPNQPPSSGTDPLLDQYERLQTECKDFLDIPVEKASTKSCDEILTKISDLDIKIDLRIAELDSIIKINENKIKALESRIDEISDLQVKDRTKTIINKLRDDTEKATEEKKAWSESRKPELLKTKKQIEEFRRVLEIISK